MKTKRTPSINNPVIDLLNPILGDRTEKAVKCLKQYRIESIGQLLGAIQPSIPRVSKKEAQLKGIEASFFRMQNKHLPAIAVYRLQRVLGISGKDAMQIFKCCERIPYKRQQYYFKSGWAFGAVRQNPNVVPNFWDLDTHIRISGGFYVIPDYHHTGPVYDQGERGTCVSNATCSLIHYKTGESCSRQFHYHQCKMTDKIPSQEGTSINAAMDVLVDGAQLDSGNIEEKIWPYNPHIGRTKHQGPPPEKVYKTQRIFSVGKPVFINSNDRVHHIQLLLNEQKHGKPSPVVIGIPIFESGFSFNTADTGWMTMPFPGEAIVGYHAMLVVGYDTDRSMFLVRNSWGPHWAHYNDKGYNGHAWIPFDYIQRYCFSAATIIRFTIRHRVVPERKRLYNKNLIWRFNRQETASGKSKTTVMQGRKGSVSIPGLLLRIAAIIFLLIAYKEPINLAKSKVMNTITAQVNLLKSSRNIADFWNDLTK